ncbi:MFS transporter [Chloroflexota bacterium]
MIYCVTPMKQQVSDNTSLGRRKILGLNPNVFFLGIVSLLTDVSSEMIFTLVPLFLRNVLGAATTIVGLVGGLSESSDAIFRIFSGWFSDRIGKRKLLAVLGYSVSTVAKPFMYLATSWGAVLSIRFSDRIGKGVRTSSRDALIAGSVSAGERGKGFGLHRAMDTSGAVLGLAIAAIIIYLVQGGGIQLSLKTYQWLVLVGVIPAVLAVPVLLFFVHEKMDRQPLSASSQSGLSPARLKASFDTRFKVFLAIMAVFTLGNSSDFFVVLRAQNLEAPLIHVVLMLVLFNTTYAITSLPMGILSDRLGRRWVITLGWFVYALVYLGFALASNIRQVWLLFACYGIYYGVVEGVARAFVADLVAEEKRGTAYGLYHGVVGLTLLPASLLAGWLWDAVSPAAPFYLGASLAFVAMLGIMILIKE